MKLLIFVAIVIFILGFYSGIYYTVGRVVVVAKPFIDVDREMVDAALFKYYSRMGETYNAPICINTGNQTLR